MPKKISSRKGYNGLTVICVKSIFLLALSFYLSNSRWSMVVYLRLYSKLDQSILMNTYSYNFNGNVNEY